MGKPDEEEKSSDNGLNHRSRDDDFSSSSSSEGTDLSGFAVSRKSATARTEEDDSDASKGKGENLLTEHETVVVVRSKILVYLVLIVAMVVISTVTFIRLDQEQTKTLNLEVSVAAQALSTHANARADAIVALLGDLVTAITSQAINNDERFPNVTLNDFDLKIRNEAENSKAELVGYAPILRSKQSKAGFEAYTVQKQGWIDADLKHRGWRDLGYPIRGIHAYDDLAAHLHQEGHGEGHDGSGHSESAAEKNRSDANANYPGESDAKPADPSDGASHSFTSHRRQLVGTEGFNELNSFDESSRVSSSSHPTDDASTQKEDESNQVVAEQAEVDGHEHEHEHATEQQQDLLLPLWQLFPVPRDRSVINMDLFTHRGFQHAATDSMIFKSALITQRFNTGFLPTVTHFETEAHDHAQHPRNIIVRPVYNSFEGDDANREIVGMAFAVFVWDRLLSQSQSRDNVPILVRVDEACGPGFWILVEGARATYLRDDEFEGTSDEYAEYDQEAEFASFSGGNQVQLLFEHGFGEYAGLVCSYKLRVRPTKAMVDEYKTNAPIIYTLILVAVSLLTFSVFLFYDWMVSRRQKKLLSTAEQSNAIVSSLFPQEVKKRLMDEAAASVAAGRSGGKSARYSSGFMAGPKSQMNDFLDKSGPVDKQTFATKPLADLFPAATIMFADIVGFTAWSSTREPAQVFILLETIYQDFDEIARNRRVFKVETVGDCYVAVCGLPQARRDHHVVMARFARDCLSSMPGVLRRLEVELGPETADLTMRVGLHSGPVTAGVLRGERARFQLFGDTVNTAARMESTGVRDEIHISQETADLLRTSGKGHWVIPRGEQVMAKGKGCLTTFWLSISRPAASTVSTMSSSNSDSAEGEDASSPLDPQTEKEGQEALKTELVRARLGRLIDWNAEVLSGLLSEIKARRKAARRVETDVDETLFGVGATGKQVLEEVQDIITLPKFDAQASEVNDDDDNGESSLEPKVVEQLHKYVQTIAFMYQEDNAFHNYEHASHVTMSVKKLLSRIVAPEIHLDEDQNAPSVLHDHTYGITSDPLTQFAVVLSALIHDVDHPGVPNSQLVLEKASMAELYKGKSVAEQNSVDLAWDLLMDSEYDDLRRAIYCNADEFQRFRHLVVNTVMATDIMDKDLSAARKARWNTAFTESVEEEASVAANRKATIVIEHIIQASDVAHTMQHWLIYRKWNARFFEECYKAYADGRSARNPAETWYNGELSFFDFYIIPLAKKLQDCGVFGVAGDEYLSYAMQNRREWEVKGREVVEELMQSVGAKTKASASDGDS